MSTTTSSEEIRYCRFVGFSKLQEVERDQETNGIDPAMIDQAAA
ncbi:hypothetical protein ACLB6G_09390 [Zhengella sp. ZM62]